MSEKQQEMWDLLCGLDAEKAVGLLTDWHGLQLLDDGFYGHLIDEGYIDEPEEEPDAEEAVAASEDFECFCGDHDCKNGCPLWNIVGDCEEIYNRIKGEQAR